MIFSYPFSPVHPYIQCKKCGTDDWIWNLCALYKYNNWCVFGCSLLPLLPSLESSPPSADSPSKWRLTDVVTNHQREERLRDKLAQAALLEAVEKEDSTTDLGELKFWCLVLDSSVTLRKEYFV